MREPSAHLRSCKTIVALVIAFGAAACQSGHDAAQDAGTAANAVAPAATLMPGAAPATATPVPATPSPAIPQDPAAREAAWRKARQETIEMQQRLRAEAQARKAAEEAEQRNERCIQGRRIRRVANGWVEAGQC